MDAFLSDQPSPILEVVALFGIAVAIVLASVARSRSADPADRGDRDFWRAAGLAGYIWAASTALLLGGSLAGVEGLVAPIWLLLALGAGLLLLAIILGLWIRRRPGAEGTRARDPARPDGPS